MLLILLISFLSIWFLMSGALLGVFHFLFLRLLVFFVLPFHIQNGTFSCGRAQGVFNARGLPLCGCRGWSGDE